MIDVKSNKNADKRQTTIIGIQYSVVSDVQCTVYKSEQDMHCTHCNELAFACTAISSRCIQCVFQWFVRLFIVYLIERFFNLHAHQLK